MNVSLFPKSWDTSPSAEYQIDEILQLIKEGEWQDPVLSYRFLAEKFSKRSPQASNAKKNLPAFTVSGTFTERKDSGLIKHSGFVAIDIDDLNDVDKCTSIVKTDPYIYASFVSAGGHGLCLIIKVDPTEHKEKKTELFDQFKEYFEQRHDIQIDKLQDISRLRFVSFDPYLYKANISRTFRIGSEQAKEININGQARQVRDWEPLERFNFAVKCVDKDYSFTEGNRHTYILQLAFLANKMGIARHQFESFVNTNFSHFRDNPSNAISWVYQNRPGEHGLYLTKEYGKDSYVKPVTDQDAPHTEEQLKDILEGRRAEWGNPIPEPPAILSIQGGTISTAGNITVITGPSKSGKTGVLNAIMAGTMVSKSMNVDTLGITIEHNIEGLALIYIDTEQSKYNFDRNYRRVVDRAGLSNPPEWFQAFWLRGMMPAEMLEATKYIAVECAEKFGGVFMFVVDGIGDYVLSVNDDVDSNRIVEEFARLGEDHNCPIVTVLHFNPGTMKERGHIGSQLQRKAESIIKVSKDEDRDVSTIGYKELRNAGSLTDMEFQWDDSRKMHVSLGHKPKALSKEEKKTQSLRDMAVRLLIGPTDRKVLIELIKDELGCSDVTASRKISEMVGRQIIGCSNQSKGPYWPVSKEDMPF